MKLSTRCRYGTQAMIEIARHYKKGPLKRGDIARSQGISSAYLENILISLKTQNLIRTIRGVHGGFTLDKDPKDITMYQILTALEGPIALLQPIDQKDGLNSAEHCIANKFWLDFHDVQVRTLKATSLQSLLDIEMSGAGIDYSI